ncbi:MAG: PDZ domain-containing protein [Bryobacteraceae bacterium]
MITTRTTPGFLIRKLSRHSRTTDSRGTANSAEVFFPLMLRRAACALIAGFFLIGTVYAYQPEPPQAPEPPQPPQPPALHPEKMFQVFKGTGGSFLGIGVVEIDSERAKALNLREEHGVEVTRVHEDSPASQSGLMKGDVIQEYNGQRVEGLEQFLRLVRETPPNREVKLTVSRNGSVQSITLKTGSRKEWLAKRGGEFHYEWPRFEVPDFRMPDIPKAYMSWRSSIVGIEAEALDSQLAEYFGVKEGVLVRSVTEDSAAQKAGLKAGDVIVKVDGTDVSSPREVTAAVRAAQEGKPVNLTIMREKRQMTVALPMDEQSRELFREPWPRKAPRK